jgi:hypothetical protein
MVWAVGLCAGLGVGLLATPWAQAQGKPVFTVDMVQPRVGIPVESPAVELEPPAVVRVFEQACVQTRGDAGVAIDWALGQGYESVEALRGSTETLLEGKAGTVLAVPGTAGRVMLAVSESQCTVWAEQQPGPWVRREFASLVGRLSTKGARVQLVGERNVERAGAWRTQTQWRYRAVGGTQDMSLAVVTTLTDHASTQVLRLAPMAAEVKNTPDGVPLR